MKEKSCLIHLLAFHEEISVLTDERSGHVDPDFSKAFGKSPRTDKVQTGKWAASGGQ